MTEAEIDAGLEAILAKPDTESMLDELRELFGDDYDVDSRFTVAQVMIAMESSFNEGAAWEKTLAAAFARAGVSRGTSHG